MTDGTSQGLFIVVAIVIFGIFVVLAYILFEDTLSPALATMFSDVTEKSQSRLQNGEVIHFREVKKLSWNQGTQSGEIAYIMPGGLFEQNQSYKLTFDLTLDSGSIEYLGGHLHTTDYTEVRINNKVVKSSIKSFNDWNRGVAMDMDVGDTVSVSVKYHTNLYDDPLAHAVKSHHISIGRFMPTNTEEYNWLNPVDFNATLKNIELVKLSK